MANYTKENLLSLTPANVPEGTLAMKVGDEVFTAGNTIIMGTDVSATTATAEDVVTGMKFFTADGKLATGTLDTLGSGGGDFYQCTAVSTETVLDINVSNNPHADVNGLYKLLENSPATGNYRVWKHISNERYICRSDPDGGKGWVIATTSDMTSEALGIYAYAEPDSHYVTDPWLVTDWVVSDTNGNDTPAEQFGFEVVLADLPDIVVNNGGYYQLLDATPGKRKWGNPADPDDYLSRIDENPEYIGSGLSYEPRWTINDRYYSAADTNYPWEIEVWDDDLWGASCEFILRPVFKEPEKRGAWSGKKAVLKIENTEYEETVKNRIRVDHDGQFVMQQGVDSTGAPNMVHYYLWGYYELVNEDLQGDNRVYYGRNSFGFYIIYRDGAWVFIKPNAHGVTAAIGPSLASIDPISDAWTINNGMEPDEFVTYFRTEWVEDTVTRTKTEQHYEFEDTVTDGLNWGNGFTPQIGGIYNDGAMIKAEVTTAIESEWDALSQRIQNGEFSDSNIGDIIEVSNTALTDVGLIDGKIQFEIVAVDNAALSSAHAHNITLMAKNMLFGTIFDSSSNVWANSSIRRFLQNDFFNCLDPLFTPHIARHSKNYYSDTATGSFVRVEDNIFLPSYTEMGFGENSGITEGTAFPRFADDESRKKAFLIGTGFAYWLSSISPSVNSNQVWCVYGSQGVASNYTYNHGSGQIGIVPAIVFV